MSSAAVNGLAGAGGGIIAQIITYPLQTIPSYSLPCAQSLEFVLLPHSDSVNTSALLLDDDSIR